MAKYTDIDLYFTKNDITNDANVKYDLAAISQAIKNIVLTTKGEKLFDSQFGANAYNLLYDDFNDLEISLKQSEIAAAIQLYEPRAEVQSINITDSGLGYWNIAIAYIPVYDQSVTKNIVLTVGNDK